MPRTEKQPHPLELEIDRLEKTSKDGMDEVIKTGGQWEDIGFHRPLGNYFYGLFISIFMSIIGIVLMNLMMSLLYPYPEINGYSGLAGSIYAIVFTVFDTGTGFGIQRFIAEWRIKNPQRMLGYIQFYVWYQMLTGLPQITWLSIAIMWGIKYSNLSYLSWFLLIIIQKQWPSMLGIFREIINGLQLYNKSQILGFVSGTIFQYSINITLILGGRWIGMNDPALGEIMGMAIGAMIAGYINDLCSFAVSAYYFNKAMNTFGYTWKDCFRLDRIDRTIVKQCLVFGFQVSIVPLVSTATSTWVLFMMIANIPSFPTYRALLSWVGGIIGFIDQGNFSLVPSIAEAYMNDKKELTRFYIANSLRWNGFLMMMFLMVLLGAYSIVIEVVLGLSGLRYYVMSFIFFIPALIHRLILPFISYPDSILVGILKINFYTFSRLFEEVIYVTENYVWMYVLKLQNSIWGIVYILAMERFLCRCIKMVMMWVYIHKKCFKVKFYLYQMLICPAIAGSPILLFGILWKPFVFDPMVTFFSNFGLGEYNVIPPAAITILIAIVFLPLCVFMPLTGLLGGWDTYGLMTLRKAVNLAGPSKPFANLLYKSVLFGAKHSKLHNRFRIPWEQSMQEIKDLMIMKRDNLAKLYNSEKEVGLTGML